jgi:hypothetical protein
LCTGIWTQGLHLESLRPSFLWSFFFFLRWGLTNYFPRLALNHDPPDLCLWVATITGMSHWHPAQSFVLTWRTNDYSSGNWQLKKKKSNDSLPPLPREWDSDRSRWELAQPELSPDVLGWSLAVIPHTLAYIEVWDRNVVKFHQLPSSFWRSSSR